MHSTKPFKNNSRQKVIYKQTYTLKPSTSQRIYVQQRGQTRRVKPTFSSFLHNNRLEKTHQKRKETAVTGMQATTSLLPTTMQETSQAYFTVDMSRASPGHHVTYFMNITMSEAEWKCETRKCNDSASFCVEQKKPWTKNLMNSKLKNPKKKRWRNLGI